MKGKRILVGQTFFEIWMMAYKKGYENGYMDKVRGHEYNSGAYAQPPDVLRKIFESSEEE